MNIARLQVRAGDLDAAAKAIRLSEKSSESDNATFGGLAPGPFEALGGKLVLIDLLAQRARLAEARLAEARRAEDRP